MRVPGALLFLIGGLVTVGCCPMTHAWLPTCPAAVYTVCTVPVLRPYCGRTTGVQAYSGRTMGVQRAYRGCTVGVQWAYIGHTTGAQWTSSGRTLDVTVDVQNVGEFDSGR